MSLAGLVSSVAPLARTLRGPAVVLEEGARAPVIAAMCAEPRILLLVTATGREAEALAESLTTWGVQSVIFPSWETLPHERLSPSSETIATRLQALRRVRTWNGIESLVVIASVRAALQPIAATVADSAPLTLAVGERHNLLDVSRGLLERGYQRVDMVSRRGEMAVRGGILDVFPPLAGHPVRVDFFGDEIDEIREFSIADQRSLADVSSVEASAVREIPLTADVRRRSAELAERVPSLRALAEPIAEGIAVPGMESLLPALVDQVVPLVSFFPETATVIVIAPDRVRARAESLRLTNQEFLAAAWNSVGDGGEVPVDLSMSDFVDLDQFRDDVAKREYFTMTSLDSGLESRIESKPIPSFVGDPDGAVAFTAEQLKTGGIVVVVAAGQGTLDRARDMLAEAGLAARPVEEVPANAETGVAYLVAGAVDHGVHLPGVGITIIGEAEFFGRRESRVTKDSTRLAAKRKSTVDPLSLVAGDYIVHETHGIGRFVEMVERDIIVNARTKTKAKREYLVIEYAPSKRGFPGDKLYVPTDQLGLVSRYVGGEDPTLSKMGGSDWSATKGRARKAVREIAVELVKLYAARAQSRGFAFPPDTPWQRELEDAFPYHETPDQLTTIDEVKADMEREIPMDRLLAGDVGFGKTEVAVRATFKAVMAGKQVAVIAPTTLLVRQHTETFRDRFAGFPVRLAPLSRFQTDSEAKQTVQSLADGTLDVVIGTHRLLSSTIAFKDLGLVIIDEEQRFGVEHKEALKKLKNNVDVLAMSATPIPRTLEMAIAGIREMSTLATPPEERHPVLTYVGEYSDDQVAAAIKRELLREGQVFYVHNRVASITAVANRLGELVPDARIAVAHGKLTESQLEAVMLDFWDRKYDVLVSTTIIETGLDVPNANTLIVDRADKHGLSQLHQLRGRVGRSRERAYAYFLYDRGHELTEHAYERLKTISQNSDLGGGMAIAMKDLELRGAGNLLGAEQAGHIAGVGFDLYLRMISEAVGEFKGEVAPETNDLRLEIPVDARIPDDYIDSERLRLEAYQKLSAASFPSAAEDAIDREIEELVDRYGDIPEQVATLAAVARLRRKIAMLGITDLVTAGTNLRIVGEPLPDSRQLRLQRLYSGAKYVTAMNSSVIPMPAREGDDLIEWVDELVTAVYGEES
ncbi:MAG: transcription-repair coupling factor [Microbacteriaceae bacterium]